MIAMSEPDRNEAGADLRAAVRRKGSFVGTLKAVAWSFVGLRKNSEYEKDVGQLNPLRRAAPSMVSRNRRESSLFGVLAKNRVAVAASTG